MSMDLNIDPDYAVNDTGQSTPYSPGQQAANRVGIWTGSPTGQAFLANSGLDNATYNFNRSNIQADLALNQALAAIGAAGGGGGSNPILDALRLQGNQADRDYLNYQTTAAQKALGYQNQTFDLNQQGNALQKAILALSGKQNKINIQGLTDQYGQLDLVRALNSLDVQSNDLNKLDVQGLIRGLGLSRQQLGLQDLGLQESLNQLGINRQESQASADTQMRNSKYDAIARGASTSEGYLKDRADIQGHLQRALAQIGSQEKQVGYNREDLGVQGKKLDEQEGAYNRQLQQLGLNDQRFGIKGQQIDFQGRDIQRQIAGQKLNAEELGIRGQDLDRLNQLIDVQRNQAGLNTYSDYARINNALQHLNLDDQGIGVGGGSGGGSSVVAQQALAGILKGQANLDALNQRQLQGIGQITQQIANNPGLLNQILGNGGSSYGSGSAIGYSNPLSLSPPNPAATQLNQYNSMLTGQIGNLPPSAYPGRATLPDKTYLDPLSPFYGWENRIQ